MISCLEDVVGFLCTKPAAGVLNETDLKLFRSLNFQCKRRIALTDKQCELINRKLDKYQPVLLDRQITILPHVLKTTRIPVRVPDRTRKVSVINSIPGHESLPHAAIAVKAPYRTSVIRAIDDIKKALGVHRTYKQQNTHYFPYTERNLEFILTRLRGMKFELCELAQRLYSELKHMTVEDCHVSVVGYTIHNADPAAIDMLTDDLGELNSETLLKYRDRAIQYGLEYFDNKELASASAAFTPLSFDIATRESSCITIPSNAVDHTDLAKSLFELERTPLLLILGCHDLYNQYLSWMNVLSEHINEIAVLFSESKREVRKHMELKNISCDITDTTRIVMTEDTKTDLYKEYEWSPMTLIMNTTQKPSNLLRLIRPFNQLDLAIYYGNTLNNRLRSGLTRQYNMVDDICQNVN